MKFPSLIRTNKFSQFHYEPRYYDPHQRRNRRAKSKQPKPIEIRTPPQASLRLASVRPLEKEKENQAKPLWFKC